MRCSEPAASPASSGYASCHGSFGELLQGVLPELGSFLVTLPIELHARAISWRAIRRASCACTRSLRGNRAELAEALLSRYGLPLRGELTLDSEIPREKASRAARRISSRRIAPSRVATSCRATSMCSRRCCVTSSPAMAVMHEGVVAYAHREARLLAKLGSVPPLVLVAIDEGGEVETPRA